MFVRLKELRETHKYSQKYVSSLLNCSLRAYCNYEAGLREMPVSLLIKLADIYDETIDYIVGRD
ncbi:MAG: helix-turn-helix transcriptional regulator [Firmicutes bacterium]|nr:helix-turn-helix transcriptional regulator [Bacillota bacterium]